MRLSERGEGKVLRRAVILFAFAALSALAPATVDAQARTVSVSVNCEGEPETVRVTNGTGERLTVVALQYTAPTALGNKFGREDDLSAGHTITYRTGIGAPPRDFNTFGDTHVQFFRGDEEEGIRVAVVSRGRLARLPVLCTAPNFKFDLNREPSSPWRPPGPRTRTPTALPDTGAGGGGLPGSAVVSSAAIGRLLAGSIGDPGGCARHAGMLE